MALQFKNRIEIIDIVPASGPEVGGEQEVTIAQPWADIKTMKGSEYDSAMMAGNVGKSRFIIRYRKGIEYHHKIKFKGLTYEIESITNDDEKNYTITLIGEAIIEN